MTPTPATSPILPTLRAGGVLKCGGRSHRFFMVHESRLLSVDQTTALKLASDGTLRPNGIDSHSNYVFALDDRAAVATKQNNQKTNGAAP